jgi:holo-[acyl-carrier protein] synthase
MEKLSINKNMILGVGIDLIDTKRIKKLLDNFNNQFENRIFSEKEIAEGAKKSNEIKFRYYAKRFAAKESFSKAIGLGIGRGIDFKDISIENDSLGKPFITLAHSSQKFLEKHLNYPYQNIKIDLSLSDEGELAQAIVILSSSIS